MPQTLKVAKTTDIAKLAGAIAHGLREDGEIIVSAIGAESQRITGKAMELAGRFLSEEGSILRHIRTDEQVSRQDGQGNTVTATLARYTVTKEEVANDER